MENKQYKLDPDTTHDYLNIQEGEDFILYSCKCGAPYCDKIKRGNVRGMRIAELEAKGFVCPGCKKKGSDKPERPRRADLDD